MSGRAELWSPSSPRSTALGTLTMPCFNRVAANLIVAAIATMTALTVGCAQADPLPADFVYLRDIDPSIQQDIRYAGANNFVGRRLAGYEAAECIVRRAVGLALRQAQRELAQRQLSLKMLDCYRPQRAVDDIYAWAQDGNETPAQRRYNPSFSKTELFRLGYVATRSGHSSGAAVDLTLVDLRATKGPSFDSRRAYADCTAAEPLRAPEASVDMGTGYDCSDAKAHTASRAITPQQRRWRETLLAAMSSAGFKNYRLEWWHFSLPGIARASYDFPIVAKSKN